MSFSQIPDLTLPPFDPPFSTGSVNGWRSSTNPTLGVDITPGTDDSTPSLLSNTDGLSSTHGLNQVGAEVSSFLVDPLGNDNDQCKSKALQAKEHGIFRYKPPEQCKLMVVCAGSPRAASTAHCAIAGHVLGLVMQSLRERDPAERLRAPEDKKYPSPINVGYWNYHLHSFCGSDRDCDMPDGNDGSFDEFVDILDDLNLAGEKKSAMVDTMGKVRNSLETLGTVDAQSTVIVKTHEFDSTLLNACDKTLVLTSWRDRKDVLESAIDLGWFNSINAKNVFDQEFTTWQTWRRCWMNAAERDSKKTWNHDLGFESLNEEATFRNDVEKIARMVLSVLNVNARDVDVDTIVEETVEQDFCRDLNPQMSNGNLAELPTEGKANEVQGDGTDAMEKDTSDTDTSESDDPPPFTTAGTGFQGDEKYAHGKFARNAMKAKAETKDSSKDSSSSHDFSYSNDDFGKFFVVENRQARVATTHL